MLQIETARERRAQRNLAVTLASSPSEVLAAQKLRWRVFVEELGARLDTPVQGVDNLLALLQTSYQEVSTFIHTLAI